MATKAFIFDPVESPKLTSADVASIREFLRQYQEYRLVWAERVAEGAIARTRKPKSVLRCMDPDLRNRIRKYEMGADLRDFSSEALVEHLMQKVEDATQAVGLKDVLGNLSFDAVLTDPKGKVGVPRKGNCNPDREGGSACGAASSGGIRIIHDKWKGSVTKDLRLFYRFLVAKYEAWYAMFPQALLIRRDERLQR